MKSVSVVFISSKVDANLVYGCVVSNKASKKELKEKIEEINEKFYDELDAVDDLEIALPKEWECKFFNLDTDSTAKI